MFKDHAYNRRNAQSKRFFDRFTRDADKHHEVLRDRTICREIKRMLNTDVPYLPPAGLLEPKPEPMEKLHGDYCFMYKEEGDFVQGNGSKPSFIAGPGFKAYLRRLAKDIFDIAVREVSDEVDHVIFEEEESTAMSE